MIPPRPSLFALLTASLAITACAAPPPDFHTYHLGEVPPSAREAKAHKHHPQQERKGQKTTASASKKKAPATVPQKEPLVRWWMFKPEERFATAQGQRGVAQNSRAKAPPTPASNKRTVAQPTKPNSKVTPAPSTNRRAVLQNTKPKATPPPASNKRAVVQNTKPNTKPSPAPTTNKPAWFEAKKPQNTPAPSRQPQTVTKNSRTAPAPIAVQSQQPPARRDHPERVQARSVAASQYPVAKKSRQDGYVTSPYTHAKINVKRVPHGAQVLDPSSEKVFINP